MMHEATKKVLTRVKQGAKFLIYFFINIGLKSYETSVLKYYNKVFLNLLHEEIRSIK